MKLLDRSKDGLQDDVDLLCVCKPCDVCLAFGPCKHCIASCVVIKYYRRSGTLYLLDSD